MNEQMRVVQGPDRCESWTWTNDDPPARQFLGVYYQAVVEVTPEEGSPVQAVGTAIPRDDTVEAHAAAARNCVNKALAAARRRARPQQRARRPARRPATKLAAHKPPRYANGVAVAAVDLEAFYAHVAETGRVPLGPRNLKAWRAWWETTTRQQAA
ncbi:MAG: hypothetical protein KKB13_05705 [Chloroflexi bacterium]|nr:hypothetical protein [Chloroflexota bacterium]